MSEQSDLEINETVVLPFLGIWKRHSQTNNRQPNEWVDEMGNFSPALDLNVMLQRLAEMGYEIQMATIAGHWAGHWVVYVYDEKASEQNCELRVNADTPTGAVRAAIVKLAEAKRNG